MMNAMTTLVGTASRGCWQQQALRRSVARRTMSTTTKAGMGKRELIAAVGEKAGLDGKQAESAVKAFLETVTSTVAEGEPGRACRDHNHGSCSELFVLSRRQTDCSSPTKQLVSAGQLV